MFSLTLRPASTLYDQDTFYKVFERDLCRAKKLVVIESPFITRKRVSALLPIIQKLKQRDVRVVINTKPLDEHDENMSNQAKESIGMLQDIEIIVLMTAGHHRKIAIIDNVIYEGSLNILSQNDSCEIMRRTNDASSVRKMLSFTRLEKWCK